MSARTFTTPPVTLRLAGRDEPVRDARRMVCGLLATYGLLACEEARSRADDILLVVSELVTNTHRHADGAEEIRVQWQDGQLTVEVEDTSDAPPEEIAEAARGEAGGYGYQLITALTDRWGVTPRDETTPGTTPRGGKTVYAVFTLTRSLCTTLGPAPNAITSP
ncbi:ATP-binding protein [Streptomyces sp. NBC_01264]|uniref:ATP-binding protein n=1 Tax=Streptomyces sp. NBC_01264 TaxID=2903804 RepID=UPI002253A2DE|nr:ATP-binding protein [Streptomyces sp. NBC_01264]MCX4784331.1 ATP-binding protein [Streptomyces sp. NBC_01264]